MASRSVTEINEEKNSVEVEINAKGEIKSTVKLYFEGDTPISIERTIERAVNANLHARNHYHQTRNGWPQKEET